MFSNAKVGDRVWSLLNGWGTIVHIVEAGKWFDVQFDSGTSRSDESNHYFDGKRSIGDKNPTLFWDEIHFDIPPKPKRKVKKTVEGWAKLATNDRFLPIAYFFDDYKKSTTADYSYTSDVIPATLTYEIEE